MGNVPGFYLYLLRNQDFACREQGMKVFCGAKHEPPQGPTFSIRMGKH